MSDEPTPISAARKEDSQLLDKMAQRLQRAERKLKNLQWSIVLVAVLACLPLLMRLDKAAVISGKSVIAESVLVQNTNGDIVAQFSAGRDGTPSISLFDANNKIRLLMSVGASGPSVSLLDPQQVSRATLSLNNKSDPSLSMSNADKLTRSVFSIDSEGSGRLVLYGAAGGLDRAAHDGRVHWTPAGSPPVDAFPRAR
jgi:hypothetical protein